MRINGNEFTIGADPELFICNGKQPVSAWGMVPGSKEKPHPVDGGAVQVDGMALEYNIDPCSTEEDFVQKISSVQKQLREMVSGYEIWEFPTANFEPSHFEEQPFEAKEMGCEPDYNAYTGTQQAKPSADSYTRTAGGHIHIGGFPTDDIYSPLHMARCIKLVKYMDLYVGLISLLWDDDDERRKMYGQWGSFRPKPYGVEYRSLSNKWIFDEKVVESVFNLTKNAIHRAMIYHPLTHNVCFLESCVKNFKTTSNPNKLIFSHETRKILEKCELI